MNKKQDQLRIKLELLADEMVDNIINTSDTEILKEIKEEYGDPSLVSKKFNELLKKSQIEAGKAKLKSAQEALKQSKNKPVDISKNNLNAKEKLSKFLNDNPQFKEKLTLAARNAEDISENDAIWLLDDLEELKKLSDDKGNDPSA